MCGFLKKPWVVPAALAGVMLAGATSRAAATTTATAETAFALSRLDHNTNESAGDLSTGADATFGRALPIQPSSYPALSSPGETPEDGRTAFLSCWNDRLTQHGDRNDGGLTIEVNSFSSASEPDPTLSEPLLIPLPSAAWNGLYGLLGLGAVGAVRRSRGRRW